MIISKALKSGVCLALALAAGLLSGAPALAASEGPGWVITGRTYPTRLSPAPASAPKVSGTLALDVFDVGAAAAGCTQAQYQHEVDEEGLSRTLCSKESPQVNPITVTDVLPAGVRAVEAGNLEQALGGGAEPAIGHALWECAGNGPGAAPYVAGATIVTCTNKASKLSESERDLGAFAGGGGAPTLGVESHNPLPVIGIAVDVRPAARERETNQATIAGGGAPTAASTSDPVTVSSAPPSFEFAGWDGWFSNADGTLDTQAGSHPYEATFSLDLASLFGSGAEAGQAKMAGGEVRTIEVELPPGFVGNPTAVPQCPRSLFQAEECPPSSMVGTNSVYFANVTDIGMRVFNLVPPPGVPAEFAFTFQGLNTYLDAGVRSGGDYGITQHVSDIVHAQVRQSITTLWGQPGEASHDLWRDGLVGGCGLAELEKSVNDRCPETSTSTNNPFRQPFLTLPTACGEPQPFVIRATSWTGNVAESKFYSHDSNGQPTGFTGCVNLGFAPAISTAVDTSHADTPAGFTVEVRPPVGGLEVPGGLGTADIRDTTVALPVGLVINPGQAAGLQVCPASMDGLAPLPDGQEDDGPADCPAASKVGTVKIKSPLIEGSAEKEFEGDVYVLQSDPPELKLLLAASADGVNLKLIGEASLCESAGEAIAGKACQAPGQLITTFKHTPQLPFTVLKLSFSGGPQAALSTPTQCGSYQTTADFTPWSSPFEPNFLTNAAFSLSSGPDGGPCPSAPLPFDPELTAGATTDQAGGFTHFSLLLQRGDGQQRIERLQFKAPPGLGGMLSAVALCGEPQAAQGRCADASKIGHAAVAAGAGPYPLVVPQPGQPESSIYLTGPYAGAPFGLSIVTPVIAGPFNLGTVITRARIEIDPRTAQITVTTDPLPQVIAGVPTDLRLVNAVIDREGFMFNPTNCSASSFSGTAWGTPPPGAGGPGASAPIASRFQVGSCRQLEFKPRFSVSTKGHASRANGASLTAKVSYPSVPQGQGADIAYVKVSLPKQLPSRLTTLQKACTSTQFDANPAGCPQASFIGHAVVHTPELPVPLTGPAVFVSHGGQAFPSLTLVLQGDGVTIDLVGDTFISRAGITSTTFKTVPDAPFSTFELTLPQGPYSALTANVPAKADYSLCATKLMMPSEFIGQNGATLEQNTRVAVTGCAKAKHRHAARAKQPRHARRSRTRRSSGG